MKFNTLFVVGVCAGTLLVSCNPKTAQERQLSLTHTTLVDGDAYRFIQLVGSKAVYENDYASYAAGVASSSQAKQIALKAQEVYGALIPGLDSLALIKQVDFPIKGAAKYETPAAVERERIVENHVDSVGFEEESVDDHLVSVSYSDNAYIQHVKHETAIVKDQLQRMANNTNKEIQVFAKTNLEKVTELFTLAGGEEDAHAHH